MRSFLSVRRARGCPPLRHAVLACALAAALAPVAAPAQNGDPAVRQLVEQGRYWQAQYRNDRARETWQRLLRIDPDQPDALRGLGEIELQEGRLQAAQERLAELERVHPDAVQTRELRSAIALRAHGGDLDRARQLARAGDVAAAVAAYREVFEGAQPPPSLAREYYQVLAGSEGGYDEARAGLQRLVEADPRDATAAFALAQVLSYREPTRRDAIARLDSLRDDPAVGGQAQAALRQALLWLDAQPADAGLYRAYLDATPGDAEVAARLARVQEIAAGRAEAADPIRRGTAQGFAALDGGRVDAAERSFQQALARSPNDADALGGLGLVRLRQREFAEAQSLLERASRAGTAGRWRQALDSARYWNLLAEAEAARAGDPGRAQALLREAIAADAREPTAHVVLGDLLSEAGDLQAAEAAYRAALALDAGQVEAQRGLVGVYQRSGRASEAQALAERLPAEVQERLGGLPSIRAQGLRLEAERLLAGGDPGAARQRLEQAMVDDPDDAWVRLDLARLYLRQGDAGRARELVASLLVRRPLDAEALQARALLAEEMDEIALARETLARIPEASRTPAVTTLAARLQLRAVAERARLLAGQGRQGEALRLLEAERLRLGAGAADPDAVAALSAAYAAAGDGATALELARELAQRRDVSPVDARLAYANALSESRQDAELVGLLRELQNDPLDAGQRRRFDALRIAYVIRQVDALRTLGNLESAYAMLAPVLAERPADTAALSALARLYADAGDRGQALRLYRQILEQHPDDVDALIAAAGVAAAEGDLRQAGRYVDRALAAAPDSPETLVAAGRIYRAAGRNARAEEYFQAALAAQTRLASGVGLADVGGDGGIPDPVVRGTPAAANPFAGMTGETGAPRLRVDALPAAVAPPTSPAFAPASVGAPSAGFAASPPADWSASPGVLPQAGVGVREAAVARSAGLGASSGNPVLDELRDIQAERSSSAAAGLVYRTRDGEAGLGELDDLQVPVQARFRAGDGHVVLRATPTVLDAGRLDESDFGTAARFGGGPDAALDALVRDDPTRVYDFQSNPVIAAAGLPGIEDLSLGEVADFILTTPAFYAPLTQTQREALVDVSGDPALAGLTAAENLERERAWREDHIPFIQGFADDFTDPVYGNRSAGQIAALLLSEPGALSPLEREALTFVASGPYRNQSPDAMLVDLVTGADGIVADIENDPIAQVLLLPVFESLPVGQVAEVLLAGVPLADDQVALLRGLGEGDLRGLTARQLIDRLQAPIGAAARPLGSQDASGVGLSAGYERGGLRADIGTTPLGFQRTDVVGGVRWRGEAGRDLTYAVDVSRRPVTDTLLSFAGTQDVRAGLEWGGVTASGARVDVTRDDGRAGLYGYAAGHALRGHNVEDNERLELGGGAYVHLLRDRPDQALTLGLNLTVLGYSENLSGFTYGHGGYFSPQRYLSVGVPFDWIGSGQRSAWRVGGSVGVQSFREDEALFFPTDPGMQLGAEQAYLIAGLLTGTDYGQPVYEGQTKTGVSYNLAGQYEYQVAPQISFGGQLELNNARDYRQFTGGVYLRYLLDGYARRPSAPQPLRSPYAPGQ